MKIRLKDTPPLSHEEVKQRMSNGERLRDGSARCFGLWKLGRREVAVLGDEVITDDQFVTTMYVAGLLVEIKDPLNPDWMNEYRLATDDEVQKRLEHIAKWGVLDLHQHDMGAADER